MNKQKTTVSNVKWSAVGTVGRSVFQLLQIAILTRFLPREAFGLVAMAVFVVQFSNIFVDLGMTAAILHKQDPTKEEYSSIYWLNIFISITLYVVLFFGAATVARFYGEPELRKLVPILGVNLLLMAMGRQHQTIMQKQFKFKDIALIELFSFFVGLISAVTFAVLDYGVYSLVFSTLISTFISNSLFLIRNIRLNPILFYFNIKKTKPFLIIGGYATGSTLLDFFSREMDVLIIGKMLGANSLGLYSLAKQIVLKISLILNPIVINVLNPMLSSVQKEADKLKDYALKAVYVLATINFPIYLLLIVLSKEILGLLYGGGYVEAHLILVFYAIAIATQSINNPSGSLQIAKGRTDIGFKWTILSISIFPLVIFLSSKISINAVAMAIALLHIGLVVPLWWMQFRPLANIRLKEYLNQFIRPFIFMLVVSALYFASTFLYELPFGYVVNLIIKGCFAIFAFYGLMAIFDRKRVHYTIKLIGDFVRKG